MTVECIAIVGAGHAGVQAAASLRDEGFDGRIELISAEHHLPYHRPPLSKRFAAGLDENDIALRPASFYGHRDISLRRGVTVEEIDPANQRLSLSVGQPLAYDHLIIATGACNNRLGVRGETLAGVVSVRSFEDARNLAHLAKGAKRAVVIGAGFLSIETAVVLSQMGLSIRIAASRPLPLSRAVTLNTAFNVTRALEDTGIEIGYGAAATHFEGRKGQLRRVHFNDGTSEEADLVVIGIGATANTKLARASGLEVGSGILVDSSLRTSVSNVSAIGDCAEIHTAAGRLRRLESVHNATTQARKLAAHMTGRSAPKHETPWFWSDIGTTHLRMVGLFTNDDTILASRTQDGGRVVLCFRNGIFVAAETINANRAHLAARKILDGQTQLSLDEAGHQDFDIVAHATRMAGR